jgi:serine/threonine protein kinase
MSDPQSPDDRTVRIAAPVAGAPSIVGAGDRLPVGTRLAEFEITGFVGEGGFSIVYLAWDHSLERRVALKEYLPSSLAARNSATHTVAARSERHRETFDAGLKSFINEGKLLAQFDHPSLVKVYRFWEQQGTAYMVMPFYEGITLKNHVRALATPPDEAWLRQLLSALTAALSVIHNAQCFHRDIAPDNVMLLADGGKPLLLDFGAARRVIGDKTQALTVILKPGYAPIEQYADDPGLKQGPWTDVYALGAVVYWAITRKTPPPAVGRVLNDAYVPLVQCAAGRYSERFLAAIDRALRVLPDQRTPSIERLREELGLDTPSVQADPEATVLRPTPPQRPQQPHDDAPAKRTHGLRVALAGGAALVAAAGVAWWVLRPPAPPPPASQAQAPAPAPSPSPAPPPTPAAPAATTAAQALAQLTAGRDAAIDVKATQAADRSKTLLRVQYQSSEAGYAYVFGAAADANDLVLLHPAPGRAPARSAPSGQLEIAGAESAGLQQLHLLIAREPRDLAESGWVLRKQSWLRRLGADNTAAPWGPPRCASDALRCDAAYGMTEVIKVTNVMSAPQGPASTEKPDLAATSKPAQPGRSEPATTRREAASTEGKPRSPRNAECVEALRRASLGDASPELIEKLKSPDCR